MKRWTKYVKPYLFSFIAGPLCMIVEVIGEVLMPRLLSVIINRGNEGTLTVGTSAGFGGLMALTALLMLAGGVGGAYFATQASVNFAADLRTDIYRKIQSFSFANIDKFSAGSLVTRLTNDVTQLQNFVNMLLRMALRSPGMMIGALIMAISIKPSLSLVFAIVMPLMLIVIGILITVAFPKFTKLQVKLDKLNSTVRENVTNVRVVKSFVREEHETEKFKGANRDLKQTGMSASRLMIFMQPVMTVFMGITTMAVLWLGGTYVLKTEMAVGDLSAFLTYVTQILMSLMMVTFLLMTTSRALASGRRISEVLDECPDIEDSSADSKVRVIEGSIEFKNVSFRYAKGSRDKVLDNINLKIEAGSTVGIIGSTGCGKTTLVSLIPRLYDPDEGEVLVDGKSVREYSLGALRDGVGMVLQNNTLFSGTIADNLKWGNETATEEQLRAAAASAQADGFVSGFKDGYETLLDQSGKNVSGGQKQRLCIARALLKEPKVLILDDSTSAVDTATEQQIRRAFKNELAASTKLIIAQRISSVKDADRIVVMNEGRITGIGTHSELLEGNEEYKEIYWSQNEKKEAEH